LRPTVLAFVVPACVVPPCIARLPIDTIRSAGFVAVAADALI
jgi:hypothetical protein